MSNQEQLESVLSHIGAHEDAYLERLLQYVSRPSISAHNVGIGETADFLLQYLQDLGMDARLLETSGHPFVLGRRSALPGRPTVLLYGHYDVQPPDPLDEWVSPPFEPEVREGRIWGRGVGDNKGQHFAQLLAIESWLAVSDQLPCGVIVLLEGEEEIGSPHIEACVSEHRELLAEADLVVTADGPVHESGRSCIKFGPRGVASFELRVRHADRDFHSGNWGGVAPNPIWTLVHLLATMKNPQGEITIDGFYNRVQSPSELERAALDDLPIDVEAVMRKSGLKRLDEPRDRPFFDRLSVWPTLTINGFHGGYGGPGTKTVLPCQASVKCDMRLVVDQRVDEVLDLVEAHVARHAPEVEVIRQGGMEPSKTPLDSPFTEPLVEAFRRGRGDDPLLMPAMGGSLPDYVWTKVLGVDAFVTPYANHDEANHAPNENLEVERFFDGIRTGAALLAALGKREKPNT